MNKILLCFGILLLCYGCKTTKEVAPQQPVKKPAKKEIIVNDKDRVILYNKLDDIKEGIWHVDEWIKYAKSICDDSNGKDCSTMAEVYYSDFYGYGKDSDIAKAFDTLKKGCDLDDSQSCLDLGILTNKENARKKAKHDKNSKKKLELTDSEPFFTKARDIADKQCNNNNAMDCYVLSQIHFLGYSSSMRDRAKSKELASKSCDMGYARACIFMKINVDNNLESKKYYDKTCKLGIKEFCK